MTAFFLVVSGVLIGAGISIIWWDLKKRPRGAFISVREAQLAGALDAEVTIAPAATSSSASGLAELRKMVGAGANEDADAGADAAQLAALEKRWGTLQAAITAGVEKLNAVLKPARLSVSDPGETSWSYKNRGYGTYRRLLSGEESWAWVRLELRADGRLHASIKAHKDYRAQINEESSVAVAGLTAAHVSDLLSACLKSSVRYAADGAAGSDPEARASADAWSAIDIIVTAALKVANGALAQAGALLVPLGPAAWDAQVQRHRQAVSVEVGGVEVARMLIEQIANEIEVAVGVRDTRYLDLGRRRRMPVDGITTHGLAELIAGCAWPSIAHFKEPRLSL